MRKFTAVFLSAFLLLTLTACGTSSGAGNTVPSKSAGSTAADTAKKKVLVAYFSCSGNTKTLANTVASVMQADVYEIKPDVPYTQQDLNYNDDTTRATVEQKNDSARPALADNTANIGAYDTIIIAYPIWWGQEPRIIDTFVESYDFSGKTVVPICTSGGSDIGSSTEHLKKLAKGSANWKNGKKFSSNATPEEVKAWLNTLGL